MTEQTITIAGRRFVVVPEQRYQQLRIKAGEKTPALTAAQRGRLIAKALRLARNHKGKAPTAAELRRLSDEDLLDVAEVLASLSDPSQKPIPYEQARKRLGLA